MRIGFAKRDLTPRVGVELCGFGPFVNRKSVGIRDRLWARAMALEQGDARAVLVACDLIGVTREITHEVRRRVADATGLPGKALMISCSHTHSGPNPSPERIGWGAYDPPYAELLPGRIAAACIEALGATRPATLSHAEVPCEGIGRNREVKWQAPPLREVLQDDWRPEHPERTDTTCHVIKAEADGELLGFAGYFGCHPVVCCQDNRWIHGDFAGVATNMLEREHPGSVGLFLQGANGDVNTCVAHQPQQESLLALDVIAARYANSVHAGLQAAEPIETGPPTCAVREVEFTRRQPSEEELRAHLAKAEEMMQAPDADDEDREVRMATVRALALRRILGRMEDGRFPAPSTEVAALRIGPLMLLGSPFETFQAIKNEVHEKASSPIPLVMSLVNDGAGYAPDRETTDRGGYAVETGPLIHADLPYARAHEELVEALLGIEQEVLQDRD
ncbi:MAG: neutral/alkaline non-lysosomal ceramidase N-terminal domain-containing protein [Planctomycetota bacterium]